MGCHSQQGKRTYQWDNESTYVRLPSFLRGVMPNPPEIEPIIIGYWLRSETQLPLTTLVPLEHFQVAAQQASIYSAREYSQEISTHLEAGEVTTRSW